MDFAGRPVFSRAVRSSLTSPGRFLLVLVFVIVCWKLNPPERARGPLVILPLFYAAMGVLQVAISRELGEDKRALLATTPMGIPGALAIFVAAAGEVSGWLEAVHRPALAAWGARCPGMWAHLVVGLAVQVVPLAVLRMLTIALLQSRIRAQRRRIAGLPFLHERDEGLIHREQFLQVLVRCGDERLARYSELLLFGIMKGLEVSEHRGLGRYGQLVPLPPRSQRFSPLRARQMLKLCTAKNLDKAVVFLQVLEVVHGAPPGQVQEDQRHHDLDVRPAALSNGKVVLERLHQSGDKRQLQVEEETSQGGEPSLPGVDFVLDRENALLHTVSTSSTDSE